MQLDPASEKYELNFRGHRVLVINDHRECVKILGASGWNVPAIPAGCNTVSFPFTCAGGARALAVNQTGFRPVARDDEREVNGCMLFILGETLGTPALDDAVLAAVEKEIAAS